MAIDINVITDATLNSVAMKADANGDGILERTEIEVFEQSLYDKSCRLEGRKSKNDENPSTFVGMLTATASIFGFGALSNKADFIKKIDASKLVKKGLDTHTAGSIVLAGGVLLAGVLGYCLAELVSKVRDKVIDKKLQNIDEQLSSLYKLDGLC